MHLLNITNLDYGMMAGLFFIILVISYKFRRTNTSSDNFLLMREQKLPQFINFTSLLGVGVIEFIALSGFGAYAGIPALCILLPVFLVSSWIFDRYAFKSPLFSLLDQAKDSNVDNKFALVCYGLFMLLVAGASISIVVTMFKSLLGWEFANSTLSLVGIALVALLIGGIIAITYNHALSWLIVTIILVIVCFLAYRNIGANNLVNSLQQVAVNNKLPANYYTSPFARIDLAKIVWLVLIASMVMLLINPLYLFKRNKSKQLGPGSSNYLPRLGQVVILVFMVAVGIFALASPAKSSVIAGKKIITQQTRLNDGSIGYVVKAIPTNQETMQKGLVPSLSGSDASDQIASASGFDYASAAMVMVKEVLPLAFISLFILVLLFYKAISETIMFSTLIIIRGFYTPKFNKTGEELENLWASRVFLFALIAVTISIGLLLFKFISLYYLLALLVVLGLPLVLNLLGLSRHWLVDLLAYIIIIGVIMGINLADLPSLLPLFHFSDLVSFSCIMSGGITLYYVFCFVVLKLVAGKK